MEINGAALGFAVAAIAGVTLAFIGHPAVQFPAPKISPPAATGFALKSVSVQLPSSDVSFPDGTGASTMNGNCLVCHSAGMVLTQPDLPKAVWAGIVDKMIHTYKAPIDDRERGEIVDYLATLKVAQ